MEGQRESGQAEKGREPGQPGAQAEQARRQEQGQAGRPLRVVIADDHALLREGLRRVLEFEPDIQVVAEASDGVEAVGCAEKLAPDVLLLDINMPGMSGIEATRLVRQRAPRTRILILTIHSDPAYVYEVIKAGANGYILKDAQPKQVIEAIRAVARGEAYMPGPVLIRVLQEFRRLARDGEAKAGLADLVGEATADGAGFAGPGQETDKAPGGETQSGRPAAVPAQGTVPVRAGILGPLTSAAHAAAETARAAADTAEEPGSPGGATPGSLAADHPAAVPAETQALVQILSRRELEVLGCLAEGWTNQQIADALYISEKTVKNHVSNLLKKLGLEDRTQAALLAARRGISHSSLHKGGSSLPKAGP